MENDKNNKQGSAFSISDIVKDSSIGGYNDPNGTKKHLGGSMPISGTIKAKSTKKSSATKY